MTRLLLALLLVWGVHAGVLYAVVGQDCRADGGLRVGLGVATGLAAAASAGLGIWSVVRFRAVSANRGDATGSRGFLHLVLAGVCALALLYLAWSTAALVAQELCP